MVNFSILEQTAQHIKKKSIYLLVTLVIILAAIWIAFIVSPWPSALLVRRTFNKEGVRVNDALKKHVTTQVQSFLNLKYDSNDADARFDLYLPEKIAPQEKLITLIWVHGGGWLSGSKDQVANYCRIIASAGYAVIALDYSLAPAYQYPTPVQQVNTALAYLSAHTKKFPQIDPSRFILAGDSGGAQIAAQVANLIYVPSYAAALNIQPGIRSAQLPGVVLYCGLYTTRNLRIDGTTGDFMKTILWAYSGKKNFEDDSNFATASVIDYVTDSFPSSFISVGNKDFLAQDSYQLARRLGGMGVPIDTVFYREDYQPELPHEYQFNLDSKEGKDVLERSLQFLGKFRLSTTPPSPDTTQYPQDFT